MKLLLSLYCSLILLSCKARVQPFQQNENQMLNIEESRVDTSYKVIHTLVALCDNKYQGIVPVPAKIGNGQDPANNLYWGCSLGIKSFFKKSKDWMLVKTYTVDSIILERLVFKHQTKNYYFVADAYDGKAIKQCTKDFLKSCAGIKKDTIVLNGKTIGINGFAKLVNYIGHDGLMEFTLNEAYQNVDGKQRDAIILACISKSYFTPYLKPTNANPLVWTTGLMAPEAYTLYDAISMYIKNKTKTEIVQAAALAYAKYQKCSIKAASKLLVSGW